MRNLIILGCAALLAFGLSTGAFAGSLVDADGDGVPDGVDNCVDVANGPLSDPIGCGVQFDVDGDGYGNACDADVSQNNVVGLEDLGAILANFGGSDPITDITCNGVVGLEDLGQALAAFGANPPGNSGLACAGTPGCTN